MSKPRQELQVLLAEAQNAAFVAPKLAALYGHAARRFGFISKVFMFCSAGFGLASILLLFGPSESTFAFAFQLTALTCGGVCLVLTIATLLYKLRYERRLTQRESELLAQLVPRV